jgi:hypothetical protein
MAIIFTFVRVLNHLSKNVMTVIRLSGTSEWYGVGV